ncbi:hypothetical protein F9K33_01090 [bacterium]|nr:MAG: hypothetical protein F9K33_01090 [bacterium]
MKRTHKHKNYNNRILLISAIGLLVFAIVSLLNLELDVKENVGISTSKATSSDVRVTKIASKFICSCGSCGGEPLDLCSCEHAVKVRQYIQEYLLNNKSEDQIVALISKSYGGLKPQFEKNTIK